MNQEQNTNAFSTTQSVIAFNPGDTWTIDPGVAIMTTHDFTPTVVDSGASAGEGLFNFGNIIGAEQSGIGAVVFATVNSFIVNETNATITGFFDGIDLFSGNTSITNLGSISGFSSDGLEYFSTNGSVLTNFGQVYGKQNAVSVFLNTGPVEIVNSGVLQSRGAGIDTASLDSVMTTIINAAKGVIEGTLHGILASEATVLKNAGTMIGGVDCSGVTRGNDSIRNYGEIVGSVLLGHGNDLFNGKGGISSAIFGGGGNDRIIGGKGNVQIHVGGGSDLLTAGPGHDRFIFDSLLAGQIEKITNFKHGLDKIVLSRADFSAIAPGAIGHALPVADFHIGTRGTTVSQHIIYDAKNGFLFYDPDGHGPQSQVHFATLSTHLALTHADFLVEA
jgi:Ca2+-binding RTX toxin-like protein